MLLENCGFLAREILNDLWCVAGLYYVTCGLEDIDCKHASVELCMQQQT